MAVAATNFSEIDNSTSHMALAGLVAVGGRWVVGGGSNGCWLLVYVRTGWLAVYCWYCWLVGN